MNTDMVYDWLKSANRFPLLTADQEIDLAHKVQRGMAVDATPAEKRIAARAKNKMIQSNLKLVVNVAKKFHPVTKHSNSLDLVDLFQEGTLGLTRAVEKFKPEAGYRFSTYAYWWLRQSITRVIEAQKTTIRITNMVSQMANKARKAPGHIRTRTELQGWLGATDNQMHMVERAKAIAQMTSLDKLAKEDGSTLLELIPDEQNQPSVDDFDWEIAREAIEYAFEGNELAEDFTAHILMGESYKDRAKLRNTNRNNLSNQIQRMIKSKRQELGHLRKFISA